MLLQTEREPDAMEDDGTSLERQSSIPLAHSLSQLSSTSSMLIQTCFPNLWSA